MWRGKNSATSGAVVASILKRVMQAERQANDCLRIERHRSEQQVRGYTPPVDGEK